MNIPFLFLPAPQAKKLSHHFIGVGESLEKMFPSLHFSLHHSGTGFDVREWLGLGFFIGSVYGAFTIFMVTMITIRLGMELPRAVGLSIGVGLGFGAMMFMYFSFYPKLLLNRKVKDVERNLPQVLHHLLIQIRSGVTMFNSMESIALSGYGVMSEEFSRMVADINTGKSEVDAIERMGQETPSLFLRRIVWQMVNALKSGSDIGMVLKEIVNDIAAEQKNAIKKYGSELNPLSLFYMMLVVIFPTLGIVFLLVMFSFVGASFPVEYLLIGILGLLVVMQIMFVGLVNNKRPIGL